MLVPLAVGVGTSLGVGCASASSDTFGNGSATPTPSADLPGGGPAAPTLSDAAAGIAFLHGNPLCHAATNSCSPDSETSCSTATPPPPSDGGLPASTVDASAPAKPCRVDLVATPDGGSQYAAHCVESASPRGVDGTTCASSADCAPGYDCIRGITSGVCRHYCCSGSCDNSMSKSGGPTFCDIQQLYSVNGPSSMPLVPVCMPIKKCKLLTPGDCSAASPDSQAETCAVVTENGDTGCVATGPAQVGESCDTEHCQANLTCLGTAGDRHCYQLCTLDGNQCPSGQTCTSGSLFQDTSYGVCRDSAK
jgi:hypothetical protein